MSSMQRTQIAGNGFFATMSAALRGLADLRAGAVALPEARPARERSELFARAVHESPNSAMDWLYYAAQLRDEAERRYCIGRALEIDPESDHIRREIARLRRG